MIQSASAVFSSKNLRRGHARPRPRLAPDEKSITHEEYRKLLEDLDAGARRELARGIRHGLRRRDALILRLLYSTGIRASEICRLKVRDVRLGSRNPTIRIVGGKKRAPRHADFVPIPSRLAAELAAWIQIAKRRGIASPLFPAASWERALDRREVWSIVKRACRRAGARSSISVHSFRHAYISELARDPKATPWLLAQLARVRRFDTILTYFHAGEEARRAVVESAFRRRRRSSTLEAGEL